MEVQAVQAAGAFSGRTSLRLSAAASNTARQSVCSGEHSMAEVKILPRSMLNRPTTNEVHRHRLRVPSLLVACTVSHMHCPPATQNQKADTILLVSTKSPTSRTANLNFFVRPFTAVRSI